MFKTQEFEIKEKIAVDINGLTSMLSIGRNSAYEIGKAAGAVIKVSRRTLFNVSKIKAYMDSISE